MRSENNRLDDDNHKNGRAYFNLPEQRPFSFRDRSDC